MDTRSLDKLEFLKSLADQNLETPLISFTLRRNPNVPHSHHMVDVRNVESATPGNVTGGGGWGGLQYIFHQQHPQRDPNSPK